MEKPGGKSEPQGRTRAATLTGWIPALWSIEAIVIAGGLFLGTLVFALMAKPAFNNKEDTVGYLFMAMAVLCPLTPSIGAAHIHGLHRKLRLPRIRKPQE